jgi:hypothetical protein
MDFNQMENPHQFGPQPGDEHLPVKFYMGAVPDPVRTEAEGHPCFKDVPMVKIVIPGDRNSNYVGPATYAYQARFPVAWQAFKANEQQAEFGLPLKEWPVISKGQCEELQYLNIRTVEQLATVADVHGGKIMGFADLKRKAEVYLQAAKDTAVTMRLDSENQQLRTELDALRGEFKTLSDQMLALKNEAAGNKKGK